MRRTLVAAVMTAIGVIGIGQASSEERAVVAGEKLDSGLGSMVYGESLDSGVGTMVYGESLDSGLGAISPDDWKRYING